MDNPELRCQGVASAELDGSPVDPAEIPLADDGRAHRVRVVLGAGGDAPSGSAQPPAPQVETIGPTGPAAA